MSWIAVGAAVVGGAASMMSANKQAKAAEEAAEKEGAPWAGLQPYLTGTHIPEWMNTEIQPSNAWANYIQDLNQGSAGSFNQAPPPMFGAPGLQPGQGYSPYALPAGGVPTPEEATPPVPQNLAPQRPFYRPGEGYGDENGSLPVGFQPQRFL
jgi:hypothetical protein